MARALASGLVLPDLAECVANFLVTGIMAKKVVFCPYYEIGTVQREPETLVSVMKWYLWRDELPNAFDCRQVSASTRSLNAALASHYTQAHAPTTLQTH
jgi:hypothetical protein